MGRNQLGYTSSCLLGVPELEKNPSGYINLAFLGCLVWGGSTLAPSPAFLGYPKKEGIKLAKSPLPFVGLQIGEGSNWLHHSCLLVGPKWEQKWLQH